MTTQQRGSAWSIKLVFNLYRIFGYTFIYYLMYPVTFFYFLFATNVKQALKIYYAQLELPFTYQRYFHHLRYFAICMVDRFISKVTPHAYTFEYANKEELSCMLNKGCILLLSHYGGWATAANTPHVKNNIHVVMQEALLQTIKEIENNIENPQENVHVIDLNKGGVAATLEITHALRNDEVVAIMADRANDKKYLKMMPFFKELAGFNKNPFQIAYKLNKPLIVFFTINIGKQHYKVVQKEILLNTTHEQEQAIEEAMKSYIQYYETILKQYPHQWFNFYNFWEKE
jgi:predicted LPLAT superfamily acyltransferase